MRHLVLFGLLLGGCASSEPIRRDVTVSTVRLDCPSLGTISARGEEGLRREAAARGANHVVILDENSRISRSLTSLSSGKGATRAAPHEVYFARDRWLEGEALRCGAKRQGAL